MTAQRPPSCRFVADDQPRMLRTHSKDCNTSGCEGCQPCEERHCAMPGCFGSHLGSEDTQACPKCVRSVRTDLGMIVSLCQSESVVEELLEGSKQAAWLLGPTADVNAWSNRQESALAGRIPAGWLEDHTEQEAYHPGWVLGCWDTRIRDHYDHDTVERVTIRRAGAYLDQHLTELGRDPDIDFALLAYHLHRCRTMLEAVVPTNRGPQTGAPCPTCRRPLVRVYDKSAHQDTPAVVEFDDWLRQVEASDMWVCKPCGTERTQEDYDKYVERVNLEHADVLTASQIKAQYQIPEGTVRRWATESKVRKRGRNPQGLQLYDVSDVRTQIDRRQGGAA